jgi:hypothetical protein
MTITDARSSLVPINHWRNIGRDLMSQYWSKLCLIDINASQETFQIALLVLATTARIAKNCP